MLEITDIAVSFAGRPILTIDHLSFNSGRRYGIIGENGSGKTTLLKVISQWIKPDRGSVVGLEGLRLGYMSQKPYIFSFSTLENVLIALKGLPDQEKRAREVLAKVGLLEYANQRADKLSGGEQQRLAIARMIAKPLDILLLDEPSSATDIRGTDQIESVLLEYCNQTNCSLILTTHSPAQALRLVEETIFIEEGKIVEQGPVEQVIHNASDPKTQAFLKHWHL